MSMRAMNSTGFVVVFLGLAGLLTSAARLPLPAVLRLERLHLKGAGVQPLMDWDNMRHRRSGLLDETQDTNSTGVVQLPVHGKIGNDSYTVWPYLTRVQLGNPAKSYALLIDTGSDTLWVSCTPCTGCPTSAHRKSYNPSLSSSSHMCSDDWCQSSIKTGFASCGSSDHHGHCGYSIEYGSGATAGILVKDEIHLDSIGANITRFSSPIVFGCSTFQSGGLSEIDLAFDGILGIGPNEGSMTSQLNSLRTAPLVFSLCMTSSDSGDSVLIFGEAVEPGLVYTPPIPSKSYYSLNLESIYVNGQKLPVDPSVFTSERRLTIVDSGTTLTYLAEESFDLFVKVIDAAVDPSVRCVSNSGEPCFVTSGSLESLFPQVILHFGGGAVMTLKPHNYLLPGDPLTFCIGWKRSPRGQPTIFGDII